MWGPCACPRWVLINVPGDPNGIALHEDKHKAPTFPRIRPLSLQDEGRHFLSFRFLLVIFISCFSSSFLANPLDCTSSDRTLF